MSTREFLEQAYELTKSMKSKKEVLDTINQSLEMVSDEELIKRLKNEQLKLKRTIDENIHIQLETLRLIEKIKDATLRSLLEYKYICHMTIEEIAERLDYSVRHTTRMHSIALREAEKFYKSA